MGHLPCIESDTAVPRSSSLKGVFRTVSTETTCRRLSVNINPVLVSSGMTAWLPHDKNRGKRMGVARPVATQQKRNNKKLNIIDMNKKNLFLLILFPK